MALWFGGQPRCGAMGVVYLGRWQRLRDAEGGQLDVVALEAFLVRDDDDRVAWAVRYAARNPTSCSIAVDMHNEASELIDAGGRRFNVDWGSDWAHGLHLASGEGRVAAIYFQAPATSLPSRWELVLSNGFGRDSATWNLETEPARIPQGLDCSAGAEPSAAVQRLTGHDGELMVRVLGVERDTTEGDQQYWDVELEASCVGQTPFRDTILAGAVAIDGAASQWAATYMQDSPRHLPYSLDVAGRRASGRVSPVRSSLARRTTVSPDVVGEPHGVEHPQMVA